MSENNDMTHDEFVRFSCLDLAARTSAPHADKGEVVAKAKKFESFVKLGVI